MDGQSRASLRPAQEFLSDMPASQTTKSQICPALGSILANDGEFTRF